MMENFALLFMLVGQTVDAASTWQKIDEGCREGNPFVTAIGADTGPKIALFKGGLMAGFTWAWGSAPAEKKPKALMYALGSAGFAAAAVNWSQKCR